MHFIPLCCTHDYVMFVIEIITLTFWLMPLQIERIVCRTNLFNQEESQTATRTRYWTAQYLWKTRYHSEAPFYNVFMGDVEFLHRPKPGHIDTNSESQSQKLKKMRKAKSQIDRDHRLHKHTKVGGQYSRSDKLHTHSNRIIIEIEFKFSDQNYFNFSIFDIFYYVL